jgi:hypothetical protein
MQALTLALFNIPNPEMQALFTVLPFCQYFANLACRLRDIWFEMDQTVEQITALEQTVNVNQSYQKQTSFSQPAQISIENKIELLHKLTEDCNEVLYYVQDIFGSCPEKIVKCLINALLNYTYLPVVVQSLCVLKLRPHLQMSTCLFVLNQTFHIVKHATFITALFTSVLSPTIPVNMLRRIECQEKDTNFYTIPPSNVFYSSQFKVQRMSTLTCE